MSRGRHRFTQRDVTCAIRAATAAGLEVREVVVDIDGAIRIIAGKPENAAGAENEWDAV
jgi:hypothetical protein